MKTKSTRDFETDITLHLTRISGDVEHIRERVDIAVRHLELMNGRLRTAENSLASHKAVGITVVTALTIAISVIGIMA
tara:strand:- start:98 stop:331 length:234 start_codon:yes stop_codon:yes gene_type:complete